jgi:hypothetical protein
VALIFSTALVSLHTAAAFAATLTSRTKHRNSTHHRINIPTTQHKSHRNKIILRNNQSSQLPKQNTTTPIAWSRGKEVQLDYLCGIYMLVNSLILNFILNYRHFFFPSPQRPTRSSTSNLPFSHEHSLSLSSCSIFISQEIK